MAYVYGVDDADYRKLCRIAYGLLVGNYSIDGFISDYTDYYNCHMENKNFRSQYSLLINKIGPDAFSVLSRRGMKKKTLIIYVVEFAVFI